ncbi:mechanosensitive ion channel protein MscS [Halalkaliarchaeum desulfuricum]|uniref:Mechanosensitive ion channel protein MscS n=1 Tax=Halalkaliarchaeum desulfuricum TaxID=2055893 RepID=A0A343TLI2_9EURY|nr:mechanosensitive ion channel family protein [Halalkaliarchaeum desulfuricum]AUX09954.1 mechanosensitive ion channel protein MscS [Halalkaliarchaeum desulfuricum]
MACPVAMAAVGADALFEPTIAAGQTVPLQIDPVQNVLAEYVSEDLAGTLTSAGVFLVVLVVFYVLDKAFFSPLIDRVFERRQLDAHARNPLNKIVSIVVLFVGLSVAFGFAGYGNFLQSLATIAAAATLAIGFALQDVIRNFVSGIFIFTDKPFKIGDWIVWGDNDGVVEDISFRVTRVRTFDNELLTVPNSDLTDGVIKNPVAKDTLRLKFVFGIDYEDDIDHATELILEEAADHPDILEEPAPSVRLTELADSAVGLQARVWIANPSRSDFIRTRAEFATSVKKRFDAEDITIPFPQRTVSGRGAREQPASLTEE